MSTPAIEAHGLTKTFPAGRRRPPVRAVDGLDLELAPGTCYGLLGRNGAGKTTLLRLLLGLLHPDAGDALLLGKPFRQSTPPERARVSYVPQRQPLSPWMTTARYCAYLSRFYPAWDQPYADHLAERFQLPADRKLGTLSGG
ncbi:MAG TPA: ATP-binding cassette domain-containing protein, partial [bacterium]|nr:ATP-binding cassette domain-containing protein [bacterium]